MSHNHQIIVIAIAFLVVGIIVRYKIGKRRFNRRNWAGVPIFNRYETSAFTRFFEWIGIWISIFLMLFGLLALLVSLAR